MHLIMRQILQVLNFGKDINRKLEHIHYGDLISLSPSISRHESSCLFCFW